MWTDIRMDGYDIEYDLSTREFFRPSFEFFALNLFIRLSPVHFVLQACDFF